MKNRAKTKHKYKPGSSLSEYYHAYMNTDSCKDQIFPKYEFILEITWA